MAERTDTLNATQRDYVALAQRPPKNPIGSVGEVCVLGTSLGPGAGPGSNHQYGFCSG